MAKENRMFVELGPSFPLVPITHFSKMRLTPNQWENAWQIVGPSVQRNFMKNVPLWMIIACAYLEGLHHGSEASNDRLA